MKLDIIPVTSFQQNCSLVWDEDKHAAIIDPGGDAEKLIHRINDLQLNIELILLTHGHFDHVGAAERMKDYFNVPIWGPQPEDEFLFQSLPQQSERFGLLFEISPFTPDRWLKEGDIIQVGSISFDVLHLPGHTPGHIGFIEKQKLIGFTGDTLFRGGVGRTDFPRSSHQDLIDAIRTKLYLLDDNMIIVPGHGPHTSIGIEKKSNPFVKGY